MSTTGAGRCSAISHIHPCPVVDRSMKTQTTHHEPHERTSRCLCVSPGPSAWFQVLLYRVNSQMSPPGLLPPSQWRGVYCEASFLEFPGPRRIGEIKSTSMIPCKQVIAEGAMCEVYFGFKIRPCRYCWHARLWCPGEDVLHAGFTSRSTEPGNELEVGSNTSHGILSIRTSSEAILEAWFYSTRCLA